MPEPIPLDVQLPRFTYREYAQWPPDERWELIDGVAYAMTAPNKAHQRVLRELTLEIGNQLRGKKCELFVAPFDVRLSDESDQDADDAYTVVQPDLMVVCDPDKTDEKGGRAAPEFVIEILSPSTARHDRTRKAELYERHGVREYWIVDPASRCVEVRLLGPEGKWAQAQRYAESEAIPSAAVPGLSVDLGAVFPAA
jgi:Uma2 family endonuclease